MKQNDKCKVKYQVSNGVTCTCPQRFCVYWSVSRQSGRLECVYVSKPYSTLLVPYANGVLGHICAHALG